LLVWFQRVGTLPASTSHVLTQVANRVLIPCFLAVHVASAVSSEPELVLSSLPLIAVAQVLCAASLGHLAHQSSSFLLRPLQLSPRPSTALHQLAAAIAASLDQTTTEPTIEAAAKPAAEPTQQVGNQQLGEALMTLLLLVVMTAVCETGGGGDGLAGQLALLAVGGCGPALLILACDALLWSQRQPDGADSPLAVTSTSGPLLLNRFFTPPVFGSCRPLMSLLSTHNLPSPSFRTLSFSSCLPLCVLDSPRLSLTIFDSLLISLLDSSRVSPPLLSLSSPSPSLLPLLFLSSPSPLPLLSLSSPSPFTHYQVLAGLLIGATPLSQLFLLPRGGDGLVETSTLLIDSGSLLGWLQWQAGEMTGSMHCFMEAFSQIAYVVVPVPHPPILPCITLPPHLTSHSVLLTGSAAPSLHLWIFSLCPPFLHLSLTLDPLLCRSASTPHGARLLLIPLHVPPVCVCLSLSLSPPPLHLMALVSS
ncbi:unnamed protein product, partial [Closterium sp. Naga37s-1]